MGSVAGGGGLGKVFSAALRGVRRSSRAWAGTLAAPLQRYDPGRITSPSFSSAFPSVDSVPFLPHVQPHRDGDLSLEGGIWSREENAWKSMMSRGNRMCKDMEPWLPGMFVQLLPGREDDEGAGRLSPRGQQYPVLQLRGHPALASPLAHSPETGLGSWRSQGSEQGGD